MTQLDPQRTKSMRPRRSPGTAFVALAAGLTVGLAGVWVASRVATTEASLSASDIQGRDVIERTRRLAPVLEAAAPDRLADLRKSFEDFAPGPQEAELVLFCEWWARFDPKAALDWADDMEKATGLPLRMRVFRVWAREDPATALATANATMMMSSPQLTNGASWQDSGIQAVLTGWEESAQPGLEQWIFETEHPQERQGLMALLARRRVASRNAEEVWNWALNLPGSLPDDMLPRVASALAARDPVEAARLAGPQIEFREFPSLSRRIATRWVKRDPDAAMQWLSQLPEGSVRRDAVLETARNWISFDQPSFMQFAEARLAAFPEWLDPAFELYARTLADQGEPEAAVQIAQRLRNENRRDYNVTLVLRSWLAQDTQAAHHWMDENEIDPAIRKRANYGRR